MGKSAAMIRLLKSANPFSAAPPGEHVENEAASTEPVIEAPSEEDAEEAKADAEENSEAGGALEEGIATIFALIRSGGEADEALEAPALEETGPTYELLSELDRLWNSAEQQL
jgi:hypothetical protein